MSDTGIHASDVFISHASEDKEAVARPLATALTSMGWSVWLDELKLTVGDSLSGKIDSALAQARFGIVVLSPAFFAKQWTHRELAALAAKEIEGGAKVILPVWHNVDHGYIVERSPVLADRLGVSTTTGIDNVAKEISRALGGDIEIAKQGGADLNKQSDSLLSIPSTPEEQEALVAQRPDWWEYRLFAGVLMGGLLQLEDKWQDHQLHLPGGERRYLDNDAPSKFLGQEISWVRRQLVVERIFAPQVTEQAFGAPGEPGDPDRISHLARRLLQMYEGFMDWAASLRNTSVPDEYEELLELYARMVDKPLREIRAFIQHAADQTAQLAVLARNGTEEDPVVIKLHLTLTADDALIEEIDAALDRMAA